MSVEATEQCRLLYHRPHRPVRAVIFTITTNLSGLSIAMAYVPWQEWRSLYEVEKGFRCGTIFAELNLPFCWKGGSPR